MSGEPDCEHCPYEDAPFVEGTDLHRDKIVVGMAPGVVESMQGKPFVGPSGDLIRDALDAAGARRVGFTNAVACFPGREVDKKAYEQARKCCLPRLEAEVAGKDVLVLGADATRSVRGRPTSITKFRGTVEEGTLGTKRATYSLHPAYVLRSGGPETTPGIQLASDVKTWATGKPRFEAEILLDKRVKLPPKGTPVVVDIETTGLREDEDGARIKCYGFAWRSPVRGRRKDPERRGVVRESGDRGSGREDHQLVVAVFSKPNATVRRLLDGRYPLIAHNWTFERKWLEEHFDCWKDEPRNRVWHDTMLMAHAVYPDRGKYRLDSPGNSLVEDLLPWTFPSKEELGEWDQEWPGLGIYCGWDCVKELVLYESCCVSLEEDRGTQHEDRAPVPEDKLIRGRPVGVRRVRAVGVGDRIDASTRLRNVAMPAAVFLDRVERRGVPYSHEAAGRVLGSLEDTAAEAEETLRQVADINWNSDPQIRTLFKKMRVKPSGLRTDGNQAALHRLARAGIRALNPEHAELIDTWSKFKDARKLLSTLKGDKGPLAHVDPDGRVRCRLNLTGTSTGRLSTTNPPLHNQHPIVRGCFVAPPGHVFLAADYAGFEVAWMAHYSGDERLMELVTSGRSLHDEVSEALGVTRKVAKAINFAMGYGGGAPALHGQLQASHWGEYSEERCRVLAARRKNLFPRYQTWALEQFNFLEEHGYVESCFGFQRPIGSDLPTHEKKSRASNTPVQSAASDACLVRGMECDSIRGLSIVLLKHDEILGVVPRRSARRVARDMRKIMENRSFYWGGCRVPLRVEFEVGESWGEMRPLEA